MVEALVKYWSYWVYITIMMIGFYGVLSRSNLTKKVISLGIFQTAIFLLFISMSVVKGGVAPIVSFKDGVPEDLMYVNPIPHVLILTAIVVSVSVTAVALAVIVNIKQAYGTVDVDEIRELEAREE